MSVKHIEKKILQRRKDKEIKAYIIKGLLRKK